MHWLKKIIEKLFKKNKIKLIEAPQKINNYEDTRNNFILNLKQQADLERDDKSGYKIIPNLRLKDMV